MTAKNLLPQDPPARVWSKERHCFVDDRSPEINNAIDALEAPYGGVLVQPVSIAPVPLPTREQMGAALDRLTKPSNPKDIVGIRKAPMSTVSLPVLAEVGVAMLEGALKYGRHNYRAVGVRSSVYFDAACRHLFSWWEGQDIDPDSDMHHITKLIACLTVLRDAQIQGKLEDDRPPQSPEFYAQLDKKAAALMDKYGDRNPKHYTRKDHA